MAWFALARVLFVAAVGYSASQLEPLGSNSALLNVAFGIVLGLLIVVLELRLKTTSVTHLIGALLGGAIGLLAARTIGAALYWANLGNERVVFPTVSFCSRCHIWAWYSGLAAANGSNRRTSSRCSARPVRGSATRYSTRA